VDTLGILKELVAFDSQSGVSNKPIADYICSLLLAAGFQQNDILVTSNGPPGREKENIIARKGVGPNALMLAGHTDTVSPEPKKEWKTDPLVLTQKNSQLYGLGSTDMKAFLAAAIVTAEMFSVEQLLQPLVLVFTCDEEIGLLGAKDLKHRKLLTGIRYGIVGEPTQLVPVRLHKGYISAKVLIRGISAHSSDPKKGINAIERAVDFISDLRVYRQELNEYVNRLLSPPYPTLSIGAINGGLETNRVPSECRLKFDIRPIPGQRPDEIMADLQRLAGQKGMIENKPAVEIKFNSSPTPPMETAASSLIVRVAQQVTNKEATSVPFSTEASIFNASGIETVILGPGSIDQAHKPNEYIEARYLEQTVETLRQIVTEICCKPEWR